MEGSIRWGLVPLGDSDDDSKLVFEGADAKARRQKKSDFLSSVPAVKDTIEAMAAIGSPQDGAAVQVTTTGRAGLFRWQSGDLSAECAADPDRLVYVPSDDDPSGEAGAWVLVGPSYLSRQYADATAAAAAVAANEYTNEALAGISAGAPMFATVQDGIDATQEGDFFSVAGAEGGDVYQSLWRHDPGNVAKDMGLSMPSSSAVSGLLRVGKAVVSAERDGVVSVGQWTFGGVEYPIEKIYLAVKVFGARPGKFYGIRYFGNGQTAAPSTPPYAWEIVEYDAATYAEAEGATGLDVWRLSDTPPNIDRDGVQTVTLHSPVVAGLRIVITLDTDALPAEGQQLASRAAHNPGYSWIINPGWVVQAGDVAPPTPSESGGSLLYTADGDGGLTAAFRSEAKWYRVRFQPNGYNNLPNFRGVDVADDIDGSPGGYTQLSDFGTDWLPPIRMRAQSDGDGASAIFTGGNHGSSGSASGDNTAVNRMYDLLIDGVPTAWGDLSGSAQKVSVRIVNDVMGYNTVSLGRYVMREFFVVTFTASGIEVECGREALEDLRIEVEYANQLSSISPTFHEIFIGGQFEDIVPWQIAQSSGPKSEYPDAWAVIQRSISCEMGLWIDHGFGIGDGEFVGDALSRIIGSGGKRYGVMRYGNHAVPAGTNWKWRGGYAIQSLGLEPDGLLAAMQIVKGARSEQVVVSTPQRWLNLPG